MQMTLLKFIFSTVTWFIMGLFRSVPVLLDGGSPGGLKGREHNIAVSLLPPISAPLPFSDIPLAGLESHHDLPLLDHGFMALVVAGCFSNMYM